MSDYMNMNRVPIWEAPCNNLQSCRPEVQDPLALGPLDHMVYRFNLVNEHCDMSSEPVTFSSVSKHWMGGTDILDYVVSYATKSDKEKNIPSHWHYVTFGLSDIHGRKLENGETVKPYDPHEISGLGFELTFRLKADCNERPPEWPVNLLQKLARYTVHTQCSIAFGDHISWPTPLHGIENLPCKVAHMVVTKDMSIPTLSTVTGSCAYRQIVGVTSEEVEIARRWNAASLLDIFQSRRDLGGKACVTDIFREFSITELDPSVKQIVAEGIRRDGSDLHGVSSRAVWSLGPSFWLQTDVASLLSNKERKQFEDFERMPYCETLADVLTITELLQGTYLTNDASNDVPTPNQMPKRVIYINKINLTMNEEASSLLPLALRGRVDHHRHFTFNDSVMSDGITFVPKDMPGAFTSETNRFAACKLWLHVQLDEQTRDRISTDLTIFHQSPNKRLPKFFVYPEAMFAITIVSFLDPKMQSNAFGLQS